MEHVLIEPLDSPVLYLNIRQKWKAEIIAGCKQDNIDILGSRTIQEMDNLRFSFEVRNGASDLYVWMCECGPAKSW